MGNPEIIFFPNGNTSVLTNGEQQPHLQQPWITLFAEFLEKRGANPLEYTVRLPNGRLAKFFRTSNNDRWNWEIHDR